MGKTKKYISEKVKDISRELILLYKKRLELKKKPYSDYPEEDVFASEFKYNLTPDQKKAVVEINNDLKKIIQWIGYYVVMLVLAKLK